MGMKARKISNKVSNDFVLVVRALQVMTQAKRLGIWPQLQDLLIKMEQQNIRRIVIDQDSGLDLVQIETYESTTEG